MEEKEPKKPAESNEEKKPIELDVPLDEATSEDVTESTFNEDILRDAIERHDAEKLKNIFDSVPDADIAKACEELDIKELITLFRDTKSEQNASLYDELSQETKEALVQAMTNKELVALINQQSADDVADTVGDMPANLAKKVLAAADPDMRQDINKLLKYQDDTAGAIMTTEFLEIKQGCTVKEAIEAVRKIGREAETVYTIFVRNDKRRFVGTLDLDDLIWAKDDAPITSIMNKDAPYCHVNTDKEEVANMFRKYDLNAMAVLNEDHCLLGIVTVDDAVDVMTEESAEDMARMTNMEPTEKPYMSMTAWESAKKCFPWLIALLILGTFTTMVLNRLETQQIFVSLPILVSFVPTLMDTGGNAGGQTTGLMIRGLAVNEFTPKDVGKVLWKEFKSGLLVALFTGIFAFLWVLLEQYTGIVKVYTRDVDYSNMILWNGTVFSDPRAADFALHTITFAGLVAITMFIAIIASKLIGTLLPLGAAAIKKDPALLSQPMLTTAMDVTTLLIYFLMACLFFPDLARV